MTSQQNGEVPPPPQEDPSPHLDLEKLHALPSEQQDLSLLNFSADLVRHVSNLDADNASRQQAAIKKELLGMVNLTSPTPTRIIRNNLGTCFKDLFGKCNRKLLYESINDLSSIANAGKDKDIKSKHAAIVCLGYLMEGAGDSAVSLSGNVFACALKLQKTAQTHAGLRAAIFKAFGRTVIGIGGSIDETSAKEVWRSARYAVSNDKSYHVQIDACWCMQQLIKHTNFFDNTTDFEKLQLAIWKAIESSCKQLRHAGVACLAVTLVKSFSEKPSKDIIVKKPKKAKGKGKDEEAEEDIDRPITPVLQKPVTALSFDLSEILKILSARYVKFTTTNRSRAAIAICYRQVLQSLGEKVVEGHYGLIIGHFFVEVLGQQLTRQFRYRTLMARKYVHILISNVVHGMIGESAQLNAARFLMNEVLKDYPQVLKERPAPPKWSLITALSALEDLIIRLGSAIQPLSEMCREALAQVLQHPSYTVQIYTARTFKTLVTACPSQLLSSVTLCMNTVGREVGLLNSGRQSPRRCIGYAYGLAALLNASAHNPLYGSIDVYARVLEQATNFLKSSGSSNVKISATQIQVAWIMIGGLMSLGPNFVKIHLPQLLLMWRNALPPPPSKDEIQKRVMIEQSFLTHVRECALGSIIAFLHFNSKLVTADVAKRLASMLQTTISFLSYLPNKKTTEDVSARLATSLQLLDLDVMVRRRVFQCFKLLVMSNSHAVPDIVQESNVVSLAVSSFADPDNYQPSSLSASIASSAGNFESIWDLGDNSGFGVTGLVQDSGLRAVSIEKTPSEGSRSIHLIDPDTAIEQTARLPMVEAWEHDGIFTYISGLRDTNEQPHPPATELVNAAITAFALAFPLQSPRVQGSILEQILSYVSSITASPKDPAARRAAVNVNVAAALLLSTKVLQGQTVGLTGTFQSSSAEKVMQSVLHTLLIDSDDSIRLMAAEALGRLASICGTDFTNNEISQLVEMIVSQREPSSRAGSALALSFIHAQLGGMAAGFHLKTIVGILMSLAADQHPTVHYWALESLARVSESAGLTFSGFVSGSIGLLGQLYILDTHNFAAPLEASSNLEIERNTVINITKCVDAIINVLGPDLQDMSKPREMILRLIRQLGFEEDPPVLAESTKCLEHFAVYAPGHMEFDLYVRKLQSNLSSSSTDIRDTAIIGIANLMRKDAQEIISSAEPGLEEKLWDLLDESPDCKPIRNIFENWLQQSGLSDCHDWVRRCNGVLTKSRAHIEEKVAATKAPKTAVDLQDEEVAGFAASAGAREEDTAAPSSALELMRWQVRLFAMDLLADLISMIIKDATFNDDSPAQASLQQEVGEVVKIAFSASTAGVVELRVRGLGILDKILKMFGSTPDPDFVDVMLLEQYQAQISSALTPAFAADSSPELAAEAVNVCATFISIGIVTDIERMGRIHKLLVSALDSFADASEAASIGDLQGLSANTQVMVRMAVFSAWADLQIASTEQKYLEKVVKPHVARLTPLWLSSLREYARLRFEPDASSSNMISQDPETLYAALSRETLLKFYQDSWLRFVDAIASLIDEDSEFVFDALDGKADQPTTNGINHDKNELINYREEPTAFFFVLFGLAFEALAARFDDSDAIARARRLDILNALKKILRPSVAGTAIYQDAVFSESMDLLDRMVLTEGLDVQTSIVEIARNMCIVHPSSRKLDDAEDESLSDDIDQLFELTRIIVLALAGLIPGIADSNRPIRAEISDEGVVVVRLALDALVDAAEVFPSIIKSDLHACILHLFITILGTGSCQAAVVPTALPIFRRFVDSISRTASSETRNQIHNTLSRFLLILQNAQKRENEASLPCEKNTLLASTILVTTAHSTLAANDKLIPRLAIEVAEALSNPTTTKMAAGCARSLLLMVDKNNAIHGPIAAVLLPRLVAFLATPSDLEELDETASILAAALVAFATSSKTSSPAARAAAYNVVIAALLARVQATDSAAQDIPSKLLGLAAADQGAFRAAVLRLGQEERGVMERVLREGQGRGEERVQEREAEGHTIALRMDF
ncbi:HEAT repeat protein-like protein [Myriangium duriaei CBS 260.36]|uniref:HEAT repeat protein-like protein n=1 Tax=Myriangium duriaei CBS 260.36 TaxID=1168546 RepID=A0A9P4JCC6_9PEZI|nr:HEAT repeat protein-like protein [Myriangium duriaei CBS 260.36]